MKNKIIQDRKFWQLFLITTILWYLVIGFVNWEWDWIKHMSETSSVNRLWFFLCLVGKMGLDVLLWKLFEDKPREEEEQSTYIYEDEIEKE